jgi:hypothetical protein
VVVASGRRRVLNQPAGHASLGAAIQDAVDAFNLYLQSVPVFFIRRRAKQDRCKIKRRN